MDWLLMAPVAAGAAVAGWRSRSWLHHRHLEREEVEEIRRIADEDVTVLGEQLQRLDAEVGARELDDAARVDYQTALDAYESAQRAVHRIHRPEQVSTVTDTLSQGRYALACVQARVAGRPLPAMRVPCFFDPRHGPAAREVLWTDRVRGTHRVPACAQDAARVEEHESPPVRTVRYGGRQVPYWQAGAASLPYSEGYFNSSSGMAWLFAVPDMYASDIGFGGAYGGGGGDGGGWGGDGGGGDGGGL